MARLTRSLSYSLDCLETKRQRTKKETDRVVEGETELPVAQGGQPNIDTFVAKGRAIVAATPILTMFRNTENSQNRLKFVEGLRHRHRSLLTVTIIYLSQLIIKYNNYLIILLYLTICLYKPVQFRLPYSYQLYHYKEAVVFFKKSLCRVNRESLAPYYAKVVYFSPYSLMWQSTRFQRFYNSKWESDRRNNVT